MIVFPAVDIRDGCCVQLVGGDYANEKIRLDDPVSVARGWSDRGFLHLHVVDLDAALGRGENTVVVDEIIRSWPGDLQVGGGVSTTRRVAELLGAGADRVVVGTRAVEDNEWLAEMCERFPGRLVVAADARNRSLVSRGWTTDTLQDVVEFVRQLGDLDLAAVMVTAVHREGRLQGPDIEMMSEVVGSSRHSIQASGGIAGIQDLRTLVDAGVSAAIVGMAIYTGALDPGVTLQEFGQ